MNTKRYDMQITSTGVGEYLAMAENEKGSYVLYDDVKHFLERPDNSGSCDMPDGTVA